MSEFQYYEFLAIDKPLSDQQQRELRAISTRARITATSFTNTYDWGDLKADPTALVQRYFDLHVYMANWGVFRLILRLPKAAVDLEQITQYCVEDTLDITPSGDYVLLSFYSADEELDEWMEPEDYARNLVLLREELLHGDYRCLYLAWLKGREQLGEDYDEDEEDENEGPPVPPGLNTLSPALISFVEFLGVNTDLIDAAAPDSPELSPEPPADIEGWIASLQTTKKDDLLLRWLGSDEPGLRRSVLAEIRKAMAARKPAQSPPPAPRAKDLLHSADQLRAERRRKEAEQRAKELKRQELEKAKERAKYLDDLAAKQTEAWQRVEAMIETKQPNRYAEAVTLLLDLRDIAVRANKMPAYKKRIASIRTRHDRKSRFIERMDKAQLQAD